MKILKPTFTLSLFALMGCQTLEHAIHPSKPLELEFYEVSTKEKSNILITSTPIISQKVGEGWNVGERLMGEIFVERTPKEIVTNRFSQFAINYPEKHSKIETCEIQNFSSYYENKVLGWWVQSGVRLKITLIDKSEFIVYSRKEGIPPPRISLNVSETIRVGLTQRLDDALNDCMSQIAQKI